MKGFKNAKVYVDGKIIKTDVCFDEKIRKIANDLDGFEAIELPADCTVFPGFIDTHIHGAGGADAMDGNYEALKTIAKTLVKEGTTSFLATTMTQSTENINNALKACQEYINNKESEGAELLGVHLEGPFISVKACGAQPIEYVQAPNIESFKQINKSAGGNIKIVSLAPENEGALDLIKYLSENKIFPSVGHTVAKYNDVKNAENLGLNRVTHTFNAQSPVHHREIGVAGTALLEDGLYAEVICDGIHICKSAVRLLQKNKPHDKLVLITDAMRAKGMPDGESELGGQTVIVKNGEARLTDGTLAGSVLKMNNAIKNIAEFCNLNITEAVDFATINAATSIGMEKEIGSIEVGKKSNFVILNSKCEVLMTIVCGAIAYKA